MRETVLTVIKWVWLPALLARSLVTRFAAEYEALIDIAVSLAALVLAHRALRRQEYYWATGFLATVFVFSPFFLVDKLFLLLALATVTALVTLFAAYQRQPAPARHC